jgi:flagellar capping protein FliD
MTFPITYGLDRSTASLAPFVTPLSSAGTVAPVSAVNSARASSDTSGGSTSGLAQQVFSQKNSADLAARSRRGDLQASSVSVRRSEDHVVTVHQTAKAAAAISAGFDSNEMVRAGSLSISIDGRAHVIAIKEGATLDNVAEAILGSGADVTASVGSENGQQRLSVVRRTLGHSGELGASEALSISESYVGSEGRALGLNTTQTAQNARLTVDGQTIERQSNSINDAVVGTTLRLDANTPLGQVFEGRDSLSSSRSSNYRVSAFTVSVQQIAAAAEARSTEVSSPYDQVQEGKVLIRVDGGQYLIPVNEGASLVQAASAINASGAPVDARLDRKGKGVSLSITARKTGFEVGSEPSTALQVSFESTGASGKPLAFSISRPAQNAKVVLNGQNIESRSNELEGSAGLESLSLRSTSEGTQTQGASQSYQPDSVANSNSGPNATAHVARLLQDQVLALSSRPLEVKATAPAAKKLYAPEPQDDEASPKATSTYAPPVEKDRSGFAAPKEQAASPPRALDKIESAPRVTANAVLARGDEQAKAINEKLISSVYEKKVSPFAAPQSPPSAIYAPAPEGEEPEQELRSLSTKARRAYAQFAA